jgi:hypothetical protein
VAGKARSGWNAGVKLDWESRLDSNLRHLYASFTFLKTPHLALRIQATTNRRVYEKPESNYSVR